MSKREGQAVLRDARRAGAAYANETLEGDWFSDFVADDVYRAPIEDLPTTKKEAERGARNVLTDVYVQIQGLRSKEVIDRTGAAHLFRNFGSGYVSQTMRIDEGDVIRSFYEGVQSVLYSVSAREWLAEEILFRSRERRGEVA